MDMLSHQPPLLDAPQGPIDLKSPIFRGRPGWGGRLARLVARQARWFRQSPLEATMTLLALALIIWGLWLFWQ